MCSAVKKCWGNWALTAIEKYTGARNENIRADFYDDYQNIPAPSASQNNLLLLDDCLLLRQAE